MFYLLTSAVIGSSREISDIFLLQLFFHHTQLSYDVCKLLENREIDSLIIVKNYEVVGWFELQIES